MTRFLRPPLRVVGLALLLALGGAAGLSRSQPALASQARAASAQAPAPAERPVALPNRAGSLKFAVLGDFGTGEPPQYQMAAQMVKVHQQFKYDLVLLVGDNLYGSERPQDFRQKFEVPYKPLLDAGVKFYASLGNHDSREQRFYALFNMKGELYYTLKAPVQDVRFFALESTYPEPKQLAWIEKELKASTDGWKIAFFHHPPYSSGDRHGSDVGLRDRLEPLFVQYNVSVVFTGHDHFYERVKPQKGITYFVTGSGGKLAPGNIDKATGITARGFDTDNAFLVGEILDNQLTFNAISRSGQIVDSGVIARRIAPPPRP